LGQALESFWNKQQGLGGERAIQAARARSRRLPSVIVVMAAVMLMLGCLSCYRQTRSELNAALAGRQSEALRVDNLLIQTQRVEAEIQRLKSDPKAIETLARETLGFVRPGEIVIRIRPDLNSSENSMARADVSRETPTGSASSIVNPIPKPATAGAPPLASQLGTAGYRQ
jgi:cell division protein FtsB